MAPDKKPAVTSTWSTRNIIIALILGVGLGWVFTTMTGCAALDEMTGSTPEQVAAADAGESIPSQAAQVVKAVSDINAPAGGILALGFGAYQLLRRRSREKWFSAAKAALPVPGDMSIRLGDAMKDIDMALGGGHTSKQKDEA